MGKRRSSPPSFHIPDIPGIPRLGWSLDFKGYPMYTSRKRQDLSFLKRGTYLHRAVLLAIGATPDDLAGKDVHHMDFNKQHACPSNLLLCPPEFNRTVGTKRDPYTGQILSRAQWQRRYGMEW